MKRLQIFISLLVIALFLIACGGATTVEDAPPVVEEPAAGVVEAEKVPAVGGTLVIAQTVEPNTLDPHLSTTLSGEFVMHLIGATLVTMDAEGNVVPYLAESWEVSDDGLVWDFKLREDVKFHDGTPLTAQDYAWTLQRALAPETNAPFVGDLIGGDAIASIEAVDDYTLRITYYAPYSFFLESLTNGGYTQPLLQSDVEKQGEEFGRHPLGVGPYKLKEWVVGEQIVLERNPDYTWGPEFTHGGAPYFDTIVIRYIPEYATILAGLESGEIDYASISPKDLERIKNTDNFQIFESVTAGFNPFVGLNVSKPPFDDIRVRQAFNLAVDKETLIKVVTFGSAVAQGGPASSTMQGYWSGAEDIAYPFDLAQAKSLMEAAGYTYNADGMLEKDGELLKLTLISQRGSRLSEVLQEQFRALGVDLDIETLEPGLWWERVGSGDYNLTIQGWTHINTSLLLVLFHSDWVGVMNFSFVQDAELDDMLMQMYLAPDDATRDKWAIASQKHIIEQAYSIPLYAPTTFIAVNKRIKGIVFSPTTTLTAGATQVYLDDAYILSK
jgi:peptide/nickel transport system substrate-binding protein